MLFVSSSGGPHKINDLGPSCLFQREGEVFRRPVQARGGLGLIDYASSRSPGPGTLAATQDFAPSPQGTAGMGRTEAADARAASSAECSMVRSSALGELGMGDLSLTMPCTL